MRFFAVALLTKALSAVLIIDPCRPVLASASSLARRSFRTS
jgi:hypothetical protein